MISVLLNINSMFIVYQLKFYYCSCTKWFIIFQFIASSRYDSYQFRSWNNTSQKMYLLTKYYLTLKYKKPNQTLCGNLPVFPERQSSLLIHSHDPLQDSQLRLGLWRQHSQNHCPGQHRGRHPPPVVSVISHLLDFISSAIVKIVV